MKVVSPFLLLTAVLGISLWVPFGSAAQQQSGEDLACTIVNNATTTLLAFTGTGCVGRDAQVAYYITDITASSNVISTATADQYLSLKYGTGTNCATGTVVLWSSYNGASIPVVANFTRPLKVPGGKDLCWMDAVTGSKTFIVQGYLGAQ